MMDVKQVIENAKHLNPAERALVAHCLISSLESHQDEGTDQAWAEIAKKRYVELISGKIDPVSWEDIKQKVKR